MDRRWTRAWIAAACSWCIAGFTNVSAQRHSVQIAVQFTYYVCAFLFSSIHPNFVNSPIIKLYLGPHLIFDWWAPCTLGHDLAGASGHNRQLQKYMHTCMHVALGWVGGVVASTRKFVVINKAKRCGVNKSPCCAFGGRAG
jgi:hypothetical protein